MPQGTTTIDFGAGATDKTITVSAPTITGGQLAEAWLFPAATASNTADDSMFDDLHVFAHSVSAGVGFSITATCRTGLAHGVHNLGYVFN